MSCSAGATRVLTRIRWLFVPRPATFCQCIACPPPSQWECRACTFVQPISESCEYVRAVPRVERPALTVATGDACVFAAQCLRQRANRRRPTGGLQRRRHWFLCRGQAWWHHGQVRGGGGRPVPATHAAVVASTTSECCGVLLCTGCSSACLLWLCSPLWLPVQASGVGLKDEDFHLITREVVLNTLRSEMI